MSAYVVDRQDVDEMVAAGLRRASQHAPALAWFDPSVADGERDFEPGAMLGGPTAAETVGRKRRELTQDTASRVGAMLWSENARSVAYRYDSDDLSDLPGPCDFDEFTLAGYEFVPPRSGGVPCNVDPIRVLNLIKRYEYQACEHPGWQTSEARAFCERLFRHAVELLPAMRDFSFYSEAV